MGLALLAYLVAVNVLLRTRLLRDAVGGGSASAAPGQPAALELDYASAYSIIPGRVHVRGLTLRGRERTVEWWLSLDEADLRVALFSLLHRTFRVTHLRSSGFAMRARLRLTPADATPGIVAALPPIAGLADPPLLGGDPPSPPTDPDRLWSIAMDDVEVEHVREIWIHTVRAAGDTTVHGRWEFHPERSLAVGPARVATTGVDLSFGPTPLITGLRGELTATMRSFDLKTAGLAIFDSVSYDGQLAGRVNVAGALHVFAPGSPLAVDRWQGQLASHVVLDQGALAAGTQVTLDAADCALEAGGLLLTAPIRNELRVEGGLATAGASVTGLRVSRGGAELASVASVEASVTSRRLQLSHLFDGDARFTLEVAAARTGDLAPWLRQLPPTRALGIRSGPVTAQGRLDGSIADKWAEGSADAVAVDVELPLRRARIAGRIAVHAALVRARLSDATVDLSGSRVALEAVSVSAVAAPAAPTPAASAASAASASASAAGGRRFLSIPALEVRATRLSVSPRGVEGHGIVEMPRAELLDLAGLPALLPLPDGLVLLGGTGRASAHADLEVPQGTLRGRAALVAHGLHARAGATELSGDLACEVKAAPFADGRSGIDLSGSTLGFSRASVGAAPPQPADSAWWGNLATASATLRTAGVPGLDAVVHLTAKDATPATALVAQNTGVPKWAADAFRMPLLDAQTRLRVGGGRFEVRSLVARGGGSSLRLDYLREGDGRTDGALLLSAGGLELGYDLTQGSSGPVLIEPQAWFLRKTGRLHEADSSSGP